MRGWLLGVVLVVTVVVLTLGVLGGSGAPSGSGSGLTGRGVEVQGAGVALRDGFTVPDGARLIGEPTPVCCYLRGWKAAMLVDGDPFAVIADLRDQATAAGFDLRPETEAWCHATPEPYSCVGRAVVQRPDFSTTEVWLQFERGDTEPVSHLLLSVFTDPGGSDARVPTGDPSRFGPEATAFPADWPAPAQTGDPVLGAGRKLFASISAPTPTLEPGSAVAAPPWISWARWTAFLRVDGSPRSVIESYRDQVAADPRFGTVSQVGLHKRDGSIVRRFDAEFLGDADWTFQVATKDGRSWMWISASAQT